MQRLSRSVLSFQNFSLTFGRRPTCKRDAIVDGCSLGAFESNDLTEATLKLKRVALAISQKPFFAGSNTRPASALLTNTVPNGGLLKTFSLKV